MSRIVMMLLIWWLTTSAALCQTENGAALQKELLVPTSLEAVFDDDFSADTREEYDFEGGVSWEAGKLLLAEGASIKRNISGGPWTTIRLGLESVELSEQSPRSEVQVRFMLDEATDCYLRLTREFRVGKPGASVGLFDTGEEDGKPIETLVREIDLGDEEFTDISIEYHNGMVRVQLYGTDSFTGYIGNGSARVHAITIGTRFATLPLTLFSAATEKREQKPYTESERQQIANADAKVSELFSLYKQGKYAESAKIGERVLAIRKSVLGEQHPDYSESLNNLATLYLSMGDYARAEPLFKQSIEIVKSVLGEQHPEFAFRLNNLAALYDRKGDYARAELLCKQSLEILKLVLGEQHSDFANIQSNLAFLYYRMGDYARAEPLYKQSLEILKLVLGEQHSDFADSLNNLALLYNTMGDYARAEPLYKQSLEIRRSTLGEQHPEFAQSLNNLASMYWSMSDYVRAEPLYKQSLEIRKSVLGEQHPDYSESLNNLATLYLSVGDYARAERLCRQSLEIRNLVLGEQHPSYATSLNNLASLYISVGDYARAEPHLKQCSDIFKSVLGEQHPSYATSLNNLAALYVSVGDCARAEPLYRQAHVVHALASTRALPGLSDAQARTWVNRPRTDLMLTACRDLEKWDSPDAYNTVWQTKLMISRLRVGQEPPPDSSSQALEIFGQLREARLQLANLVSATPEPEQAEQYRESLANASEKKESLEKQLASLNPASKRELAIRDATIDDMLQRLPEGVAVVDFVQLDDWVLIDEEITLKQEDGSEEKRTVKRPKATPVYDAFVLRADRRDAVSPARWIPLGPAEPIELAIGEWRKRLTGDSTRAIKGKSEQFSPNAETIESLTDPARQLRRLIWEKLEPELKGCHTVVLLPDAALHRLPWAALPGREPGQYLLHDYALTTASSGQQLFGLLSAPAIEADNSLLAVGGIKYDERPSADPSTTEKQMLAARSRTLDVSDEERKWSFLSGAAEELAAITNLWADRGRVQRLEGLDADERTLAKLLPSSRFAHLATHGFFDTRGEVYRVNLRDQALFQSEVSGASRGSTFAGRNPLLMSGIVMAGANVPPEKDSLGFPVGEDGILTAEEISGLRLNNMELVTLSACETGLGDVAAGEGVMGLTRVLHQAGAHSVLASLWQVDDSATLALMTEFYRNLWDKKLSKIESLRQAQIRMIESYDIQTGSLRGIGKSVKINPIQEQEGGASGLPARYWAAFQLSGDWR